MRLHAKRLHAMRLHAKRLHAMRLHAKRLHTMRLHAKRLHAKRLHTKRLHAKRLHAKRLHAKRLHSMRLHSMRLHSMSLHSMRRQSLHATEALAYDLGCGKHLILLQNSEQVVALFSEGFDLQFQQHYFCLVATAAYVARRCYTKAVDEGRYTARLNTFVAIVTLNVVLAEATATTLATSRLFPTVFTASSFASGCFCGHFLNHTLGAVSIRHIGRASST
jgi:hypothetical protein